MPIELNVEKKVGKAGVKVDAATFRKACHDYAGRQVDGQRKDFIRLGVFADWQNPYLTMDHHFEADIIRALAKIVQNGHLHKGFKPVHWCTDCRSALAEAEVEYEDKNSPAIDVRFRVLNEEGLLSCCWLLWESTLGCQLRKPPADWSSTWRRPSPSSIRSRRD